MIIAPGEALESQNRVNGSNSYANYMEGVNGSGYDFTSEYTNLDDFNDQVLGITLDEYIEAVGLRVATAMKVELDEYHADPVNNEYPASFSAFRAKMNSSGIQWLYANTSGNYERWSNAADVEYNRDPTNTSKATINFIDCINIKFTLEYGAGIKRSGDSC